MLKRILLIIVFLFFSLGAFCQDKIVLVVANQGFQDEELLKPLKYFKDEGFSVDIASNALTQAQGILGAEVSVDLIIEETNMNLI